MEGGAIGEAVASGRGLGAAAGGPDRVRVLLFMSADQPDAGSARLIESMLERDHEVVVALDGDRALRRADRRALADLAERHAALDRVRIPARRDPWRIPAGAIRRSLDYLQCPEPEQADAERLRDEARDRAPRLLLALLVLPPFRWRFGRRLLGWFLRRTEAGLPIARAPKALIAERSPDVVVVPADAELGFPQSDFVRAAQATRTPSVLVIDGTAAAGPARIRAVPTLALVADQARVNDVVRVHGLPRGCVQAVGAESLDGGEMPAPAAAVEALDEAARIEEIPAPTGRLLRPVLWLLTPVLVLALPLLRPRATIRALRRRRRLARKRTLAGKKTREQEGTADRRAQAKATKEGKRSSRQAARQRKAARSIEKRQKRERRSGQKQEKRERRAAGKPGRERKAAKARKKGAQGTTEEEG